MNYVSLFLLRVSAPERNAISAFPAHAAFNFYGISPMGL